MRNVILLLIAISPAMAQVPEIYRSVDRVVWVVDDLDHVLAGWDKLGETRIERRADVDLAVTFRGKPGTAKLRIASGFLGGVRVEWIEPRGGSNAFAEFRQKHGSGVFSLTHRVPTLDAFHVEIERLRGLGVEVLQSGESGGIHRAYFDTESEGKYALGLIYIPEANEPTPDTPPDRKIIQFAFTAHNLRPVSAYWAKLGLGAMAFNRGRLSDVQYWGKPVPLEENFGWQRGRKIVYEWIEPATSPNVFDDHMKKYGEGVHHLGINVENIDKAIAQWTATGMGVSQSGWWGNPGQPGSGRFAYIDTESIGGVTTELTWPFR